MKPGLLLIDLQRDFLGRKGLAPRANQLVQEAQTLLCAFRELNLPVIHVHTQVRADGADRMPHWKRDNTWACVTGTVGSQPPNALQPQDNEPLLFKQYWSAFSNDQLAEVLRQLKIDTLIVAGLYLHGCVRATVADAYQRGYEAWIADDAVGTTEHDQAELTRIYLEGRAATFLGTSQLLARLRLSAAGFGDLANDERLVPGASIAGRWMSGQAHQALERRNPANWQETLAWVPIGEHAEVNLAGAAATAAQLDWRRTSQVNKESFLATWADVLETQTDRLVKLIAYEIGKPLAEAREEVARAITQVRVAVKLCRESHDYLIDEQRSIGVRFRPQTVVGLITPWNNPIAIPVGKISPALAFGNGVVWKPAFEAPRTAMAVMDSLQQAGVPKGLVNLVFGNSVTARFVIDCPHVSAISFTGSVAAGRNVAARCAHFGKPLQAELGGNNAAIVLKDCDVEVEANTLAQGAFSFSGQRCTAMRRIIVERAILDPLKRALLKATQTLRIGEPSDPTTQIGPLISWSHRQAVQDAVQEACSAGAELLCGGLPPPGLDHGCWLMPAIVSHVDPSASLAKEETFGPVAVILPADDLEEALIIANSVEHGLVAALYSQDEKNRRRFAEVIQAGILKFSPEHLTFHTEAPFSGWKASGIGPPEHGLGDRQFYTKVQATYGWLE